MKRILVADDSVTIQKVIALTFADEPFEVRSVGTGAEALELIKSFPPDIVLADVIMPQMNGYELCRAVKGQGAPGVPVLLLAGTFEAFDEEEARAAGADDFITKPFESGELIEKVKALLGEGQAPAAVPQPQPQPQVQPQAQPQAQPPAPPAPEPVLHAAAPPAEPAPGLRPQAQAPPSAFAPHVPETGSQEPDIWDILSDAAAEVRAEVPSGPGESGVGGVPGFGPMEGGGVVDVGSFDVGLDRPAAAPPAPTPRPQPAAPEGVQVAPPPAAVPEPPQPPPAPAEPPKAPPIVVEPPPMPGFDVPGKSRVEDREKDFFGFEMGAIEDVTSVDLMSDAIEEVTFDMDEVQTAGTGSPEASFIVPEPAAEQARITGETMSPHMMAPQAAPEPPPAMPAPGPGPEGTGADYFSPAAAPPIEFQEPEPAAPEISLEQFPEVPEIPVVMPSPPPPSPEPVLEPPPAPEPLPAPVTTTEPVPGPAAVPPAAGATAVDDAAVRRIIEEKVEKIAWEVVPEMAEVLIREVLEKIKGGS